MYYLLLFHYNSGCTNAPQYYVIRTLAVLFYDDCTRKLPHDKQTQNASAQNMKARWRSRGIVPLILNVGARWMLVDKFRPPPPTPAPGPRPLSPLSI